MNSVDIYSLWNDAINDGGSVAMWRLPHTSQLHFLADLSGYPKKGLLDLENSKPGFAVSPFINKDGTDTLFLKPDVYSAFDLSELEGFEQVAGYHINNNTCGDEPSNHDHFLKMVDDGLTSISDGKLDKVVPARTLNKLLPKNINIIKLFVDMCATYPNAFISLISIPGIGTWMGATPELLIELSENHLRTVSLAGTQPYAEGSNISAAAWTQKEIEEQAMVSRYIIEQFKTIRLREFVETGPRTVRAGNMIHLKTEYSVDLNKVSFTNLGSVMLRLLHPTPAVCGMPRETALNFITDNENLNRELYSGFLGPVNIGDATQLYVNLRCMQIQDKRAVLYAGAGVTHDSNLENEWDETTLKCHTLLDLFNNTGDPYSD